MSENEIIIRDANESDFEGIAELFRRHNYGLTEAAWLRWKYLDNPDGRAEVYVAEDPERGIVSISARMPRKFTSDETGIFVAKQDIDVFVAKEMRGKGLHNKIWEYSKDRIKFLCVGFPNKLYRDVFGFWENELVVPLIIWRFPVVFGRALKSKPYGLMEPLANLFSQIYAFFRLGPTPKDIELKPIERFDKDIELNGTLIHGVRSADYLNWRFIDIPFRSYSTYEFCEGEEGIGYCVYEEKESEAELSYLVMTKRKRGCLKLLIDHCRKKGFSHVSFVGVGLDLEKLGFVRRESDVGFTVSNPNQSIAKPKSAWTVTFCDRDE